MKESVYEYQKAVDYLSDQIEAGNLKEGDRLPTERFLAETLSISRNSTREALKMLVNMGAIESRHGSGNYLTGDMERGIIEMIHMMLKMKKTNWEEICSFRRHMEKAVCLTIIEKKENSKYLFEAEKLLADWQNCEGECSMEEELEKDRQLHYLLVLATGNQFWITLMVAVMDVYHSWIDGIFQESDPDMRRRINQIHTSIVEALKNKEREACMHAVDEHYDLTDQVLMFS